MASGFSGKIYEHPLIRKDLATLKRESNGYIINRPFEFNTGSSNNTIDNIEVLDNGNNGQEEWAVAI